MGISRTLEAVREGPVTENRESRLLMLEYSATRSDFRRHREMTEIEMFSAAACALGGLAQSLRSSSRILSLHWNPEKSLEPRPEFWPSLVRMARGGGINFPCLEFPELAREMEKWGVETASGQPTAPSSRLRI